MIHAMKTALTLLATALLTLPAFAKDKEIQLTAAPAGVQATLKKTTDAGATLEKIEEESGGKQYAAKITDKNGLRWEISMDADGRVLRTQEKKPKKAN